MNLQFELTLVSMATLFHSAWKICTQKKGIKGSISDGALRHHRVKKEASLTRFCKPLICLSSGNNNWQSYSSQGSELLLANLIGLL